MRGLTPGFAFRRTAEPLSKLKFFEGERLPASRRRAFPKRMSRPHGLIATSPCVSPRTCGSELWTWDTSSDVASTVSCKRHFMQAP
ncbi:Hypothetical protein BN69_0052 [Methylocystis sp. SC2]|nr:Hypothetical protein BN69_0052 [Methylocystis sp. SC2]